MKTRTLLITTVLSASLAFGIVACSQDPHHPSNTYSGQASQDSRFVANRFVKHVNYARLELAMNHPGLAKEHIIKARDMAAVIADESTDQRTADEVKAGRIAVNYDPQFEYYYFPLETGAIKDMKPSNPLWIQKGATITDAEIVYLTLDLSNINAMQRLGDAEDAVNDGKLKEAEVILARLSSAAIANEDVASDASDKASDNIALARRFLMDGNYDGAHYALTHADEALDQMQDDDTYHVHRTHILAMRKQIKDMQAVIAKNNPSLMQKADAKMQKWWDELKHWTREQKDSM